MNAEELTVIRSPAACQIKADCRDHASQVGVPLESVSWGRDVVHTSTPFQLTITARGIMRQITFTQDQILGYPTGQTTTEAQEKIRAALESILPDLEEN